ncbi:uncharacterized protein LOC111288993 [Durio zibethinus]|uniref:Uncharacterized protein LOC111288993 n=1 Tax=Durio zibethinus TaxID=66656 RepID=A0A6P5Y5D0_DURZI|nr:uncharacterized protein LOC111288993 [Durio zibethinus]
MQPVLEKHFRGWVILHNYAASPNRKMWIFWTDHVQVDLLEFSEQSITCVLQYEIRKVYFSAIYGSNDGVQRKDLWLNLSHIGVRKLLSKEVLINDSWLSTLPQSHVEFLAPEVSDHNATLVKLSMTIQFPPKPFKFFNYRTGNPKCKLIVERSWENPIKGSPMLILHKKLKRLKLELRKFNLQSYGNLSGRVQAKRKELEVMQKAILTQNPPKELVMTERSLYEELKDLMKAEESYYRQKSRIRWL